VGKPRLHHKIPLDKPKVAKVKRYKTTLSTKQVEIVRLIAEGDSNKIIAYKVGLTEGTIKEYLNRVYRIVGNGIDNRVKLAVWYVKRQHMIVTDLEKVDPRGRVDVVAYKGVEYIVNQIEKNYGLTGIWDNVKEHVNRLVNEHISGVEIPGEAKLLLNIIQANYKPQESPDAKSM